MKAGMSQLVRRILNSDDEKAVQALFDGGSLNFKGKEYVVRTCHSLNREKPYITNELYFKAH